MVCLPEVAARGLASPPLAASDIMSLMGTTAPITFEEFECLNSAEGDLQLLQGELIRLPAATVTQRQIAGNLYISLNRQTGNTLPGRVQISTGYRIHGTSASWLRPDVSVTHPGQVNGRYFQGAPLIAFEVVSEFEKAQDLHGIIREYLVSGAAEVWVIYPKTRRAWVYEQNSARLETEAVRTALLPGIEIPFKQIFEA